MPSLTFFLKIFNNTEPFFCQKAVELEKKLPVLQNSLNTDTFESVILLEPGDYTCCLVIPDLATGLSAVNSAKALVPAAVKSSLTLGTPLLLQEEGNCTYIETKSDHNRLSRLLSEMHSFDQKVYVPLPGKISTQTRRLGALVPYNVAEESEAEVALAVRLIEATTGQTRLLYKKDKK